MECAALPRGGTTRRCPGVAAERRLREPYPPPHGSYFLSAARRIQVFAPDGSYLDEWGTLGQDDGEFLAPFDLDVGPDGSLYVVDDETRRDEPPQVLEPAS